MDEFMATIKMFAGNYAPQGYLYCDGQSLPIQQYEALFSLIGTTYGGDGRVSFNLPDLRGHDAGGTKCWVDATPRYIMCVQGIYPSRP